VLAWYQHQPGYLWCVPAKGTGGEGGEAILIALLAILGVDLIVIAAFAAFVLGRRRWLKRQPGEFAGAIRASSGDAEGLSPKWKRGSGRWVSDVLVWSKAPLMFRNELVPVDRLLGEHPEHGGGVKRLGDKPVAIEFASGGARIEVATAADSRERAVGPMVSRAPPPSEEVRELSAVARPG
jgi:hypothetical protein